MKSSLKILVISIVAFALLGASSPKAAKRFLMKIKMREFKLITLMQEQDWNMAVETISQGKVDLIVSLDEVEQLRQMGIQVARNPHEIRNEAPTRSSRRRIRSPRSSLDFSRLIPISRRSSPSASRCRAATSSRFESLNTWTKLTARKVAILFNGMHHAREVMSTEVPLDLAEYLLTELRKKTKEGHPLVNSDVIYVVPMLNVDGNNIVWTQDDMGGSAARINGVKTPCNRNYPYVSGYTCNG